MNIQLKLKLACQQFSSTQLLLEQNSGARRI